MDYIANHATQALGRDNALDMEQDYIALNIRGFFYVLLKPIHNY